MEGNPDDIGSSPSPFQPFKDPQPEQDDQHPQHLEMMFPSGEATEIVQPQWPLHFCTTTTTVNSSSSLTNPIIQDRTHILSSLLPPPFPSRLPYSYEGLLLPPEQPFHLAGGLYVGGQPSASFGSLQSEFSKMTAQEIMDAKALAASKSHSEAERRRRERINGHLAKLRSLLPNTTKTDKASLLAEVIMHVKELKRQTSELAEENAVPTESDELTVDVVDDEEGRFVVRASLCCDDKPDLLPELIKTLKSMQLRAVKAEIVTLGGRVRNVLLITGQDDGGERHSVASIQEALRAVMEKAATGSAADEPSTSNSGGSKRQRTSSLTSILENRSI